MNGSVYRIAGIFILVISIFFILGGVFIPTDGRSDPLSLASLIFGLFLLALGTVLYKIIKTDE